MSGVWIHMAATSMIMQRLTSDLVTNPLTFPCFYIFVPLTYLAPTASCAANMHNKEGWNAGITDMTVREEDVHDRHPVCQGHVSAFPFTPFTIVSESFASQLCLPTALTHGRFASSLCLSICLCLSHMRVAIQAPPKQTCARSILPATEEAQQQVALQLRSSQRSQVCVCLCSQQHSLQVGPPSSDSIHCPFVAAVADKSRSNLVPSPPRLP